MSSSLDGLTTTATSGGLTVREYDGLFANAPGPPNILTDVDYNLGPDGIMTYRSSFGLGGLAIAFGSTYTLNSIVSNLPGTTPCFTNGFFLTP